MSLYYPQILWELKGKNILAILPMHPLPKSDCYLVRGVIAYSEISSQLFFADCVVYASVFKEE
jgi:hypothetical protein